MSEATHLVLKVENGWRAGGCFDEVPQTVHRVRGSRERDIQNSGR
jgi:hypothetical protein